MKKSLVALAALAVVGAASAQVALTGTFSMSKTSTLTKATGFEQSDGNMFIGVNEDLGGGNKLSLSSGFDFGGRNATGSEDTSLAVSGAFGTVTLKSYESHSALENAMLSGASLSNGVADTAAVNVKLTANRNGIIYTTPDMSGFKVSAIYVNGGKGLQDGTGTPNNNKTVLNVKYANGPLTAYAEAVSLDSNYGANNTTAASAVAGGSAYAGYALYDLGAAKVGLGYNKNSYDSTGITVVGVSVPMGAATIGLDNTSYNGAQWTTAAVSYALGKMTSVKASYGYANDQALANSGSYLVNSQWRVGLFKSF